MAERSAGFTLLELLIVTVILGILASTLILSAGLAGPQAKAGNERRAMIHLINQHCEEAVLMGREGGVRLASDGYGFFFFDGESWQPREEKLFRPRTLTPPLELRLELLDTAAFSRSTVDDPPQIICDSSGQITPFSAALASDQLSLGMQVDSHGRLVISELDGARP